MSVAQPENLPNGSNVGMAKLDVENETMMMLRGGEWGGDGVLTSTAD